MKNSFHSKSLRYSLGDGSAHAVMLGMGETFIMTYAVALNYSHFQIGIMSALPVFLASLLKVIFLNRMVKVRSRKKFVFTLAFLQGLLWIPLLVFPQWLEPSFPFFLATLVTYHGLSLFIAPLWNSWMGDLVPEGIRGTYFGRRNQYRAIFELISFLIAGGTLAYFSSQNIFWGFGIIFLIAGIARLLSAMFIGQMEEPPYQASSDDHFSFKLFLRKSPKNNFGRFVLISSLFLAVTNISSPFFTAYQLRILGFSYLELTLSMAILLLFQFFSFQSWGRIGDRYGNLKILKITAIGASCLPWLWLFTDNYILILCFQALAGIFWSGFNLAAVNYIFDAVTQSKLARCVAYYNFMGNTGIALGASLGGLLSLIPIPFFTAPSHIYYFLFIVSGGLRFSVALIFSFALKEVRGVTHHTSWGVLRHFIGLSLTPEFGSRFINIFIRKKPKQ